MDGIVAFIAIVLGGLGFCIAAGLFALFRGRQITAAAYGLFPLFFGGGCLVVTGGDDVGWTGYLLLGFAAYVVLVVYIILFGVRIH